MKKVFLSFFLTFCVSIMAGCGVDLSEELSSVHLESAAKPTTAAEEASQSTTDAVTEEEELLANLADKDAYDNQISKNTEEAAVDEEQEIMVWISESGNCYHSKQSCSNMKNPVQVTLSKAQSMNKRPCKKCY